MSITLVIEPGAAETYAAAIVSGKSELVRLGKYQYGIPTAVCLSPDGVLHFGESAEKMVLVHPSGYCRAFVRKLGNSAKLLMGVYSAVELLQQYLTYVISLAKERCGVQKSAEVDVMLCCPVTFSRDQQFELRAAALAAGAHAVELMAAPGAIYCVWADRLRRCGLPPLYAKSALLINWSADRLECAQLVADASGGKINPAVMGGLPELGGEEIDEQLARYVLEKVVKVIPAPRVAWYPLLRQVREQCLVRDFGRALSTDRLNERRFDIDGKTVDVQIPGEDYARLLAPYLQRMASAVKSLCHRAWLYSEPESVLLTGDLALLPGAQKILAETLQKPVHYRTKPTDAVEGAMLTLNRKGTPSVVPAVSVPKPVPPQEPIQIPPEPVVPPPAQKPDVAATLWRALCEQDSSALRTVLPDIGLLINKPVSEQGGSPLSYAVQCGNSDMVSMLLSVPGVDVNVTDAQNNTPLHIAASVGCARAVQLLVGAGAAPNPRNAFGWTPLQVAVNAERADCVELLVRNGADVNVRADSAYPLLHQVVENGTIEMLRLLLNSPVVDVNIPWPFDGSTPLHAAARCGKAEAIRALMSVPGVDISVRNILNQTAAELAGEKGFAACAELLSAM